jgi:hypothetical protein
LVAGFLRAGQMDVIDADARTGIDGHRLPAVEAGREATCDLVYVPTLVGEGEVYRLTVRQLAIPSGKIEELYEESATGPLPALFELVNRMAVRLAPPPPPRPSAPVPSGPIRAWMSGPTDVDQALAEAPAAQRPAGAASPPTQSARPAGPGRARPLAEVPPPLRTIVLEGERRVEIEEVGRIVALNTNYSFCVIEPRAGRPLKPGDRVLLATDRGRRPTVTATVSRVERGHAIAEFQHEAGPAISHDGRVYKWVPETETVPTPGIPAVPEPVSLD